METVDQIETIVSSMTPTVEIDSVVDNGDGTQTLSMCNTYWIRRFMTITIDGNDYEVSSFVGNVSVTIPDSPLVTADSFVLQAPFYFHGTPRQVNNEWMIENDENLKYPLVYLVENRPDSFFNDEDSRLKDASLQIFFLDSFADNDDEVDEHYTNVVKPLIASHNYFVDLLNADPQILPFDYVKTNRVKVGVDSTNQGNTSKIFKDGLNAVEFVSTVTWRKVNDDCSC